MEYLEGGPLPAAVLLYILTSMTPFALRVLIVADDPLARAGIAALLADQALVTVTGLAGSDGDIPAAVTVFAPDAVVWDLGWDVAGRIDALSRFCDDSSLPVIALVASPTSAGEVQAAGARGLLSRTTDGAQLAAAATAIGQGLLVFDPDLLPAPSTPAPVTARRAEAVDGTGVQMEQLSARELDVLRGMAEGSSNKQIARALGISEHTVKFHINAILGKLDAQSRTEAVVRATRAGLILL
jgi:DNA-binding NarL/FixJ family response regulator